VAEFADHGAGLEIGLYCEVKICVSSSIFEELPEILDKRVALSHRGKFDGFWVRPGIQMEDEKNY
jgi:hypothetical protein